MYHGRSDTVVNANSDAPRRFARELWPLNGRKRAFKKDKRVSNLVHRIAAFAFAFAMAIPCCQWRHRCVVTLGKFLVVLYSKPLWRKENWKQRRKGDVRDVKNHHGRC